MYLAVHEPNFGLQESTQEKKPKGEALALGVLLEVKACHAALPQVRLAVLVHPQVRVCEVLRLLVTACMEVAADACVHNVLSDRQ